MNKKITALFLAVLIIALLAACGNDDNKDEQNQDNQDTNAEVNAEENNDNDGGNDSPGETGEDGQPIYQVGETGKIESRGYGFEYEATVNEYEITNKSDKYDMNDFYMNYDENNYDDSYIVISNVTIHNTSDENFTPSEHVPMHVSESGNDAGEDVIYDYFPEFDENLEPGESITGDLITHAEITEMDNIDAYWLKFETITANETIWELPNTVEQN